MPGVERYFGSSSSESGNSIVRCVKLWWCFFVFPKYRNWPFVPSVCGDKLMNNGQNGTDVASLHQSTSKDPRPRWALSLSNCSTIPGDSKRTVCVFWNSMLRPILPSRNKLCLMSIILNQPWLPATAFSQILLERKFVEMSHQKWIKNWFIVFQRSFLVEIHTLNKLLVFNNFGTWS